MSEHIDNISQIKRLFEFIGLEKTKLAQGKPSVFGYSGSEFTPHISDYYEIYALWEFVGAVALLQKGLQGYFGFNEFPKRIDLFPHENYVLLAIESEPNFMPPLCNPVISMPEVEMVQLIEFTIFWQGFPIYFKCGYGVKSHRLAFNNKADWLVSL